MSRKTVGVEGGCGHPALSCRGVSRRATVLRCASANPPASAPAASRTRQERGRPARRRRLEHAEIGIDARDDADRGERIAAGSHQPVSPVLRRVVHHHPQSRFAPAARSMAPPTAGAVFVSTSPSWRYRRSRRPDRTEHAQIEMAAANQPEAVGVVHVGAAGPQRDVLLAGIDQPTIDLVGRGRRSHSQHAVLRLKHDFALARHVVGDLQRRGCRDYVRAFRNVAGTRPSISRAS